MRKNATIRSAQIYQIVVPTWHCEADSHNKASPFSGIFDDVWLGYFCTQAFSRPLQADETGFGLELKSL